MGAFERMGTLLCAALPRARPSGFPADGGALDLPFWPLATLAVLLLTALLALVLRRWRRQRIRARRRREARPRYPVVLAHGVLGFDEIGLRGRKAAYFRRIPERLEANGCVVHRPRVAMVGSVASRATELAAFIRALPDPRVNIVAHSMGGLDARYAIARLGLADRVASLVTIGTPHLGTPLADLGTNLLGDKLGLRKALTKVGLDLDAFYDLRTGSMEDFNREVPDAPGVAYASVVAAVHDLKRLNPLLLPTHRYLQSSVGENDGLVPAHSQRWGEVLRTLEADHWAQIGWSTAYDVGDFYVELLRELAGRGH